MRAVPRFHLLSGDGLGGHALYFALLAAPMNVRANVATEQYQIFEWRPPQFGTALKYRVYLRSSVGEHVANDNPLYYAEVPSGLDTILLRC